MPNNQHSVGIDRLFCEAAQHLLIVRVLQLLHRLGDRKPLELVDFSVRTELAVDAARSPVAHFLDALLDGITDGGQSPAEYRRVTGFLAYFTHGRHRFGLAGVNLSL